MSEVTVPKALLETILPLVEDAYYNDSIPGSDPDSWGYVLDALKGYLDES